MIVIQPPAQASTLVHPRNRIQYEFRPQLRGTEVLVVHTTARTREGYFVPTEEARQLWRRLRSKGYERF